MDGSAHLSHHLKFVFRVTFSPKAILIPACESGTQMAGGYHPQCEASFVPLAELQQSGRVPALTMHSFLLGRDGMERERDTHTHKTGFVCSLGVGVIEKAPNGSAAG